MIKAYGKNNDMHTGYSKIKELIILMLALSAVVLPFQLQASDTDSPPFLIYVDPVTGKYTRKNPQHDSATASNSSRSDPQSTQLSPAFLIAGGLLLGSHILSRILVRLGN